MALELLFNGGLLVFFIYCFFYIGGIGHDPATGILDAAEWPRLLLGLLIVFIAINMAKVYKNRQKGETFKIDFNIKKIVTSKLFIGSVLLLIYSFSLDYLGFVFSSIIFFMVYSRLLGEKRIKILVLSSLVSVAILYVLFNSLLGIMLPRGVGAFRNFALFLESLI
ncbi:MAG: tripartite tricarboxylate transporter TctB family protein [Tissierella sp.]|nr:tripartite tricarboxylate transporter TctB family protein [Tissierella sp.]